MKKSTKVYVLMRETEYDTGDDCVRVYGVYDTEELALNEKYALEAEDMEAEYWIEIHDVYTSN